MKFIEVFYVVLDYIILFDFFFNILYQKLESSAGHKITLLVLNFSVWWVQRRLVMFAETR